MSYAESTKVPVERTRDRYVASRDVAQPTQEEIQMWREAFEGRRYPALRVRPVSQEDRALHAEVGSTLGDNRMSMETT